MVGRGGRADRAKEALTVAAEEVEEQVVELEADDDEEVQREAAAEAGVGPVEEDALGSVDRLRVGERRGSSVPASGAGEGRRAR